MTQEVGEGSGEGHRDAKNQGKVHRGSATSAGSWGPIPHSHADHPSREPHPPTHGGLSWRLWMPRISGVPGFELSKAHTAKQQSGQDTAKKLSAGRDLSTIAQ